MIEKIPCLICGKLFTRPVSHVWQVHKLSAREYKQKHGLDTKRGIATKEYKERMRDHVFANGTVNNLKAGKKFHFKKGHKHNYKRSKQTMARLKIHWLKVASHNGRLLVQKIKIVCHICKKEKMIYPRYKLEKNYCGILCRNRGINR